MRNVNINAGTINTNIISENTDIKLGQTHETCQAIKLNKPHDPHSNAGTALTNHKIFIVHGHDKLAKEETARFIERMHLEAIILHEQVNSGKTIIEKIEENTGVGYGIILYTPCDTGAKAEATPMYLPRARQNVIFEHGYLIAKLGRNNVCALIKGNIETPSDITGMAYIQMDEQGSWKLPLARELIASGYHIDINTIM